MQLDGSDHTHRDMHPNEHLLREEYRARADRDDRSLADVFADDVVWHVPGKSAIAGEYRGRDQVMEYVLRRRALADDTFEITVEDVLANDAHGIVIASGSAVRGGERVVWRAHGLYRFAEGRIAEGWVLPEDQYAFDAIWS
jgi:ketosteroid isomerase-like protein